MYLYFFLLFFLCEVYVKLLMLGTWEIPGTSPPSLTIARLHRYNKARISGWKPRCLKHTYNCRLYCFWRPPVSMLIFPYTVGKQCVNRFESGGRRSLSRRRSRPRTLHPKLRRRTTHRSGLSSTSPTRLTRGRRG